MSREHRSHHVVSAPSIVILGVVGLAASMTHAQNNEWYTKSRINDLHARTALRGGADTALGLPADTPLRGETLMRVRTLLGIRLEDIADRTKIGAFTLRCIETEAWADLPARVYLKGFLRQIAPLLRLDPDRLGRDYLAAFEAWENDNRRKKRW